jgi:hypothetical protein
MRRFSSEGQCGKGVHDHVNPQHLHSSQNSMLSLQRRYEDDNNGNNIDCKLELKELSHRIINVPAPHNGLNDGTKRVVKEDDVRSFPGSFCSSNSHSKTNICFL